MGKFYGSDFCCGVSFAVLGTGYLVASVGLMLGLRSDASNNLVVCKALSVASELAVWSSSCSWTLLDVAMTTGIAGVRMGVSAPTLWGEPTFGASTAAVPVPSDSSDGMTVWSLGMVGFRGNPSDVISDWAVDGRAPGVSASRVVIMGNFRTTGVVSVSSTGG